MRIRLVPTLVLLVELLFAATGSGAEPQSIRLPIMKAPVSPVAVTLLAADSLFVIDADEPYLVVDSRQGVVSITEDVGPMTIRSVFADGSGKPETRKYTAKHLWLIEAVQAGEVEIIITKVGEKDRTKAMRTTLVVGGSGPRPPPKPNDPVDPGGQKPDPLPSPLGFDKIVAESVRLNVPASERPFAAKLAENYRIGATNLAKGTWTVENFIKNQLELNTKTPGYKAEVWRPVFRDIADRLAAARDAGQFSTLKDYVAAASELSFVFSEVAK